MMTPTSLQYVIMHYIFPIIVGLAMTSHFKNWLKFNHRDSKKVVWLSKRLYIPPTKKIYSKLPRQIQVQLDSDGRKRSGRETIENIIASVFLRGLKSSAAPL